MYPIFEKKNPLSLLSTSHPSLFKTCRIPKLTDEMPTTYMLKFSVKWQIVEKMFFSLQIRQQLMQMLEVLDKSLTTIHPDKIKIENNALRQKIVEAYHASKQRDHQRILRYKLVETC